MIYFKAKIEKFESNGEKTGWSYVFIPQEIADQIKANSRVGFRVHGLIDGVTVNGMSLMPVKESGFILPLNSIDFAEKFVEIINDREKILNVVNNLEQFDFTNSKEIKKIEQFIEG